MKRYLHNAMVLIGCLGSVSVWCFVVIPAISSDAGVAFLLGMPIGYLAFGAITMFWRGRR